MWCIVTNSQPIRSGLEARRCTALCKLEQQEDVDVEENVESAHAQHQEAVPAQQLPGSLENPRGTWGSPVAGKPTPTPSGLLL